MEEKNYERKLKTGYIKNRDYGIYYKITIAPYKLVPSFVKL